MVHKWKIILVFSLTLLITLVLIYITKNQRIAPSSDTSRPMPSITISSRRPLPNEDKYTVSNNVLPLEDNTQGSIYSKRAQVRGTLLSWESDFAVVDTKGERLRIRIPSPVHVYCISKTVAGKTVEDIDLNTVMIDLSQIDRNAGISMTRGEVQKLFPINSSLYVLVDVGEKDSLTAYLLVGISCTNPKE